MNEVRENLVRNIKERRAALKISQMDLAARTGMSAGYIGEIEIGRKYPSPESIEKLAEALEVPPYRLFMGEHDVAETEAYYKAVTAIRDSLDRQLDKLGRKKHI